jgi:hypothetical protein
MILFSRKTTRATHHRDSAELAEVGRYAALSCNRRMVPIKLHITGDKQIEPAVMVIVAPRRSGRPTAESDAGLLRHIRKRAIVIIVVQAVLAIVRDVDVRPSVIVVVSNGQAETPALVGDTCFFSHVRKSTVVVIV